nr:hypothetical protein [Tanacetum cinerariifolium]
EEEPEEDPVEEPEPLAGHEDQFEAHLNPQPGNMNGWVDDDDDVEEEDDENKDVDIEEDDDAEIIFPYEVQGDQTPPSRVESSDSEFEAEEADDELEVEEASVEPKVEEAGVEPEVEEAGVEPEDEGADVELEAEEPDGESSTARDPQFIGGLAPSALRRDLEVLRRQERIREAESKTRMVVERLKVLESEENATLKKKLAEKDVLLDLTRMERDRAEKRIMPPKPMSKACMREIIREQFATSMNEFMANMNNGAGRSGGASGSGRAGRSGGAGGNADGTGVRGAGPIVPELTGCTYATFIKCDPLPFNGTEGAVRKWMTEEFCPRSVIQRMEQELYNLKMQGMVIDGYTNRFHELALLCPRMVEPEAVKVEQYLRGLTKSIRGDVTSSQPATINDAVCLAYQLAGQLIQDKADEATEGEKRKGEGDRGSHGDNRCEHNCRQNQRRGDCWKCTKCGKLGHKTDRCRILEMSCYNYHEKGHRKKDCPKLGRNGQGGNNHGGAYQLGAVNAQEDPKVVTGTFLLNNHYATALFDSGVDRSFLSTKFSTLINIKPVEIDTSYEVELADGKIVSTNNVLKGCTLNLLNHSFLIDLMVIELGSFDVVLGMDWLSKNDAAILCGEKKVRIPLKNKALIIEGDRNQSKARKYIENGCELFLAQVTGTVSKEKRVEDVPVICDFPEQIYMDFHRLGRSNFALILFLVLHPWLVRHIV